MVSTSSTPLDVGTPAEVRSPTAPATEGVSIVIPAYNEEHGAAPTMTELLAILERELAPSTDYEVLVVDDGSQDRTSEALQPFVGERFRVIRHPDNRGYGASIKTGIAHARFPWVMITDADGTYPAEHIPDLLQHRDMHAMVVGARIGAQAHVPLLRRPPKWVLRKLASYLSRQEIPDLNSGLRVFRKDLAEKFANILPNQFSYTTTITLVTFSAGFHVKYVPINYNKRTGKSKIRPIADTINFLKLIIRTILYFDPLRVFLPAALFFLLGSVGVGLGSYAMTGRIMDVTTVVLFVTGVQLLALGMLADMLNRRMS